jgi:hypothetical protein
VARQEVQGFDYVSREQCDGFVGQCADRSLIKPGAVVEGTIQNRRIRYTTVPNAAPRAEALEPKPTSEHANRASRASVLSGPDSPSAPCASAQRTRIAGGAK